MTLPTKAPAKRSLTTVFTRAWRRFKTESKSRTKPKARIGFLIDATASRSQTWAHATKVQAQMFNAVTGIGPLAMRLVHFGGGEVVDQGWMTKASDLSHTMRNVRCQTGLTKYTAALNIFLDDEQRPDAIILIGDMVEDDEHEIIQLGKILGQAGIKVFTFLEGEDGQAARIFQRLSTQTGGKFARFGADLPLGDLCQGVALLAAGGKGAAKRIENQKVKQLLLTGPDTAPE